MANKNINLNKLKDEIDNRKRERGIISEKLGEGSNTGTMMPRDSFLFGLLESLKTGKETPSTSLVKTVENKAAERLGEAAKLSVPVDVQPIQTPVRPVQRLNETPGMSPERDDMVFADIERKHKQTLAESMQQYIQAPKVGAPMSQQTVQMPSQLNEVYLTESVRKIVDNYLIENFGPVVEEAIKSTILEMYAVERIKEVLHENKELIKSVVMETIRELQAKSKQRAQS